MKIRVWLLVLLSTRVAPPATLAKFNHSVLSLALLYIKLCVGVVLTRS